MRLIFTQIDEQGTTNNGTGEGPSGLGAQRGTSDGLMRPSNANLVVADGATALLPQQQNFPALNLRKYNATMATNRAKTEMDAPSGRQATPASLQGDNNSFVPFTPVRQVSPLQQQIASSSAGNRLGQSPSTFGARSGSQNHFTSPQTEPFPAYVDMMSGINPSPLPFNLRGNAHTPAGSAIAQTRAPGVPSQYNGLPGGYSADPSDIFGSRVHTPSNYGRYGTPTGTYRTYDSPAGTYGTTSSTPHQSYASHSNTAHTHRQYYAGSTNSHSTPTPSPAGATRTYTPASGNKSIHPAFLKQRDEKPHVPLVAKMRTLPDMPTAINNGNPFSPYLFHLLPTFMLERSELVITSKAHYIGQVGLLYNAATFTLSRIPANGENNITTRWSGVGVARFMAACGMHSGRQNEMWALNLRYRDWPAGQVARFPDTVETCRFLKMVQGHFCLLPDGREVWYKTRHVDTRTKEKYVKITRAYIDIQKEKPERIDKNLDMKDPDEVGEEEWKKDDLKDMDKQKAVLLGGWIVNKKGVIENDVYGHGAIEHMTDIVQPPPTTGGKRKAKGKGPATEISED
ncbi:hypothetical protein QBC44DRAFT_396902 [Cladorrhinum sp. PSN332]|nr:hypothetical protein QBC44DRAFT_396902 [Cladorrhinum sp. PSN332]